jgi:hypothetical protein
MAPEIELLTKRIDRLERSNRRLKTFGIAVALIAIVFIFVGADRTTRTIEAEKFVLCDSHGRVRLTIGTPAYTGATIGTNPDDPVVWLTDDKGEDRAMLTTDGLFFANGKARPTVSLDSNPRVGLKFYGSDGKVSWSAP